jgi:hypothetical protein
VVGGGGANRRVEVTAGDGAHRHREAEGENRIGGAQVAAMVGLREREKKGIEGAQSGEVECIVGLETAAGHIVGAVEQNRHTVAGSVCMT